MLDIRRFRTDYELTQIDLAKRLGVSQSMVAAWERGAIPSLSSVIRFREIISLDKLVEDYYDEESGDQGGDTGTVE